jgi:DNA-binding beta-propeller fold protein YncE
MNKAILFAALTGCLFAAKTASGKYAPYFSALLAAGQTGQAPAPTPLKLAKTIWLPSEIKGHFDHLAIDLNGHRLFVTPEDFKAVLVIDYEDGHLIHSIPGISKPHAILYRPELDRLYVTDGVGGDIKIIDGSTYAILQSIPLQKDADAIGYDASTKQLYVVGGGKDAGTKFSDLTAIDTVKGTKLADIKIDGETLEAMALDSYRARLYVNNKAKNEVDVVDRWQRKLIASWPVTKGRGNVAMALDEPDQRLFVGCRDGKVVVFDTNTGAEIIAFPIVEGVDDLIYDRTNRRLYAAGDGSTSVYAQNDADHYSSLGNVPTGPSGRTAMLIPELGRYFVSVPQHDVSNASILVYDTVGTKTFAPAHDTVAYRVHAPLAEDLVRKTLSARQDLRKLGLHAVQPGEKDSVIIANGNATRRGIKTTEGDFKAVASGNIYGKRVEDGSYYNMKMPMFDASGRRIGLLVMEIPLTSTNDDRSASKCADAIRSELERQIPNLESLFSATHSEQ